MFSWKGDKAIQTISPSLTQNKHKYQTSCSGKGNSKEAVHLLNILITHSLDFVIVIICEVAKKHKVMKWLHLLLWTL